MKKNDPSPSPLFDEFVKTLPPYGDPRDAEIAALRQQLVECERERNAFQDQCISLKMKMTVMREERDELVATMEHLLEYWNGDNNETAMHDALTHFDDVIRAALSKTRR